MNAVFDPQAFGSSENPYPAIHALREQDPVHWSPAVKGWVLTRYDDVRKVLFDPLYSEDRVRPFFVNLPEEKRAELAEMEARMCDWLPFLSGGEHQRMRLLTMSMFAPKKLKLMEPSIAKLTDELIDSFIERGSVDFMQEFGVPLPGYVIMDLFGSPRSDLTQVKAWSDVIGAFMGGKHMPDKYRRTQDAVVGMARYFGEQIEERRRNPREGIDIISHALNAHDDDKLTKDELIGLCSMTIFAGHETTTALLCMAMATFARHPEQAQKLLERPELIRPAIDELLRYAGAEGGLVRIVTEDHELGGKRLKKGDRVFGLTSGANRDPQHFPDPDTFNIERQNNAHVTFGFGPHLCLGMALAKLEATVAIPRLLQRLQDIQLDQPRLDFGDSGMSRMIQGLKLTFRPGARLAA